MKELTIDDLRTLCNDKDNVIVTQHTAYRFQQRKINLNDVICSINKGKIIEQYSNDYPYPSCLVLGPGLQDEFLHTVCAVGDNKLWLITSYIPTHEKWTDDFKVRKVDE